MPGVSRAELAEHSGISRSNVSQIVGALLAENLLVERPAKVTGRGRTPIQLFLNDKSAAVVAVSVRFTETTVALAGLSGKSLGSSAFPTPLRPSEMVDQVSEAVGRLARSAGLPTQALRAAGVSVPGFVNSDSGKVMLLAALPEYSEFDMGVTLADRLGMPCLVENDCNLAALAELSLRDSDAADLQSFVLLDIGNLGVGAGIVLDRALYRGHDSAWVAEFGHICVEPNGAPCLCGQRGCFERYVCDQATWRLFSPFEPYDGRRFEGFIELARAGAPAALEALSRVIPYLRLGIRNVAAALNPQAVIVSGEIVKVWELISPDLEKEEKSQRFRTTVRPARLPSNELFLIGAVEMALNEAFYAPANGNGSSQTPVV